MKSSLEEIILKDDIDSSYLNNVSISDIVSSIIGSQTLYDYFTLLNYYIQAKESQKLNMKDVARLSDLPETTIKRFENLQSIPQITTLIKIFNAVGLSLYAKPKDNNIKK